MQPAAGQRGGREATSGRRPSRPHPPTPLSQAVATAPPGGSVGARGLSGPEGDPPKDTECCGQIGNRVTGRFLLLLLSHTSPRAEPLGGWVEDQDSGPAGSSTEALATHRGAGGNGAVHKRSMSAFLMASTGHGEGLNRGGTGYRLRHMEGETEREILRDWLMPLFHASKSEICRPGRQAGHSGESRRRGGLRGEVLPPRAPSVFSRGLQLTVEGRGGPSAPLHAHCRPVNRI